MHHHRTIVAAGRPVDDASVAARRHLALLFYAHVLQGHEVGLHSHALRVSRGAGRGLAVMLSRLRLGVGRCRRGGRKLRGLRLALLPRLRLLGGTRVLQV